MHPRRLPPADGVSWAQCCLLQAEAIFAACRGLAKSHKNNWRCHGDDQALSAYQVGVALGFYRLLAPGKGSPPQVRVGSDWSQQQLQTLHALGVQHGRWILFFTQGPIEGEEDDYERTLFGKLRG